MLVNGVWKENWQPVQAQDGEGRFLRQSSAFRHWVTPDGAPGPTGRGGFRAEPGDTTCTWPISAPGPPGR